MRRGYLEIRQFKMPGGAIVSTLVPQDPATAELIEAYPVGKRLVVDIKDDRDRGELREYWAGLGFLVKSYSGPDPQIVDFGHGVMVDAVKLWPTSRDVHSMLMEATGHTKRLYRVDGSYYEEVDSIAIDNMGDADFKNYYELAQAIINKMFGFDPWQHWREMKDDEQSRRQGAVSGWQRNWRPGDD